MDWTEGYVADIEYVHGFYPELAPEQLAMAALLRGIKPPPLEKGFTYFELGCGQGVSLNLLAACNPQGRFYGNDFNPTHVAGAQALADAAGLENVTILEKSFQELQAMDLPRFDFICLHGVYSWINAENRRLIVDFIQGRLKPGSVVYVSYNCLPGWSATAPLRRLMTEYAHASGGMLVQRVENALAFTARLKELQAGFFAANPQLDARLAQIQGASRNYLAHEYFNRDWTPFYHADVAAEMADGKLSFVGPAGYAEQIEFLLLPQNALALLAEIQEPVLRETVKDFLLNQQFRKDVFTRGKIAMQINEQRGLLARKRFMLATPRADVPLTVRFPVGEVNLLPEVYNPVLDELDKGPCTLTDLWAALVPGGLTQEQVQQAVLVMLASGHVVLAPTGFEDKRKDATGRFNAVVVERALQGDELQFLASPVSCSGVQVDLVDRLFLNALKKNKEPAAYAWDALRARNQVLVKDGKPLATPEENLQELAERHKLFAEKRLSRLQKLGIT
jgi:predicted O-methyltransferase YrrM